MAHKTHDIGSFFWYAVKLNRISAPITIGPTQEIDPPFRRANSYSLHIPGMKNGVAVGVWRTTGYTPEQASTAIDALIGLRETRHNTEDIQNWELFGEKS